LPDWVMKRPKQGFAPPTWEWHRALAAAYSSTLEDGFLVQTRVLKPESARRLRLRPIPCDAVSPLSFKAMILEIWCRQMLESRNGLEVRDDSGN
jgi:asparagine synthase (glutamine-hydrolysing)